MKRLAITLTVSIILCFLFLFQNGFSTVWIIQTSNYQFTPSELPEVQLGDTIRWVWIEGAHTTTSTMIPLGAQQWDAPLSISSQSYDYVPTISGKYNYQCTPHVSFGMVGNFTVMDPTGVPLFDFKEIVKTYPNPFMNSTTIEYSLTKPGSVNITFFNQFGKQVDMIKKLQEEGIQKVVWSPENLAGGVYYFRLEAEGQVVVRKLMLAN